MSLSFKPYVVCEKRTRGTAIIGREEFMTYSKSRRNKEFMFICWVTCPADEEIVVVRFPRIRWAIKWAHDFGLGNRG
jgi:hypothetical protein